MSDSDVVRVEEPTTIDNTREESTERKGSEGVPANDSQDKSAPPNGSSSSGPIPGDPDSAAPSLSASNPVLLQDQSSENLDEPELGEEFPVDRLAKLDEQLSRPKWVVPVRPRDDLEMLIRYAIKFCKEKRDTDSEPCQRFFRDGLTLSFNRILTDEAVSSWKPDIQRDIYNNSRLLVELCVSKLDQDWFVLLELLATLFNPNSKFVDPELSDVNFSEVIDIFQRTNGRLIVKWNQHNITHPTEFSVKEPEESYTVTEGKHARTFGWLMDLINILGSLNGFNILHERIVNAGNLSVPVVAALIKPFGFCAEYLSDSVFSKYIIPIVDKVISFLDELSNEALKKEATSEAKSDTFSSIMKSLRYLCHRIPGRDDIESFRLKMILRLLQISSFSGKMNALNEINKILPTVTYHPHSRPQDDDQMMGEKLAEWIKNNNVLSIVFRDNLHQPQYVEKLDRLVRFCIKEKALGVEDLDLIWASQDGKHEVIVKNVHDMLVKLAWDFSPEQLAHLFGCFQRSWVNASKKQRDELLEFIRHLAEDDKEGLMATKVLELLWNLAHRDDCPTDTMDHALTAHLKILDYSCSQERESQKLQWLQRCVDEMSNEKWVIPALKQMREICLLYVESPMNYVSTQRSSHFYYRNEIISHLDTNYLLLSTICQSLENYMKKVRKLVEEDKSSDPDTIFLDNRFNHHIQLSSRLDFVRFALKDGQLWLGHQQALMVWASLAENPAFSSDKEACYKWFAKLVNDEPDIEPDTARKIFLENVHKIAPHHLTENAFRCFDRFFRVVNINDKRLLTYRGGFVTEREDLHGIDYLWKAVLVAPDSIVYKPIELLKDVYTSLSSKLQKDQVHSQFIQSCMNRLRTSYQNLLQYKPGEIEKESPEVQQGHKTEVNKIVRCLSLLKEYVIDCDDAYGQERSMPPHGKSCWGRPFVLIVRFISPSSQSPEDFEVHTHTNESVASVRRHICLRLKHPSVNTLELSVGNDVLRPEDDKRLVSSIPLRDRMMLTVKLLYSNVPQAETNMNCSDNSTDSSEGSPTGTVSSGIKIAGPNSEQERLLPSCVIAAEQKNLEFLMQLCDFAINSKLFHLRDTIKSLLKILPSGSYLLRDMVDQCRAAYKHDDPCQTFKNYIIRPNSPTRTLYSLELIQSLLMPSVDNRESAGLEFQSYFVQCGGLKLLLSVVTDKNFMVPGDVTMKRAALLSVLKVLKLLLIASGFAAVCKMLMDKKQETGKPHEDKRGAAKILQSALEQVIPLPESKLKNVAINMAKLYVEKLMSPLPDLSVVKSLQLLGWAAACGDILQVQDPTSIHQHFLKQHSMPKGIEIEDTYLAKESVEVLCLCVIIVPELLETLQNSQDWRSYITDIVILTRNRLVRVSAVDQFFNMVTRANTSTTLLVSFIALLFSAIETVAKEHAPTSTEFFRLLSRMLNHAHQNGVSIQGMDTLLERELKWLLKVREDMLKSGQCPVETPLLDGHLGLTVELLAFRSVAEKYRIGSEPSGQELIKKLVNDFLFPASRLVKDTRENPDKVTLVSLATPICSTTDTTLTAFKLINSLCTGCQENVQTLLDLLADLFYSGHEPPITEWEYLPHIGPRPPRGFVGLKNAGATCYMNSVLQQLYMIPPIRDSVLKLDEAAQDLLKQQQQEEKKESEKLNNKTNKNESEESEPMPSPSDTGRKDIHKKVLMQIQSIFGHLNESRLQFHIPKGFWRDFRLWGEKVNLREQHDAFEFFNCLLDSLDEGMKSYGYTTAVSQVLGGSFADQKICEGCPHRYSREEPFTALNMDIRNQQHLFESLDTFVKGDLLEGANAYHCEKCDKKVDTVKRMCIKRLPKILCIQLKRFDYDWEREMAIKFNDYFEFPREFDMAPYTAAALSEIDRSNCDSNKAPGENNNSADNEESANFSKINERNKEEMNNEEKRDKEKEQVNKSAEEKVPSRPGDEPGQGVSSKYRLRGVVVHSGQASGGHYYSFVYLRPPGSNTLKWFKFDDGEVSEAKLDDEEEFKSQCFGGDFTGEVYDHVLKKTHYRRQKKWWSAYLLFYDRLDQEKVFEESLQRPCFIPESTHRTVQKQNLEFLHNKAHFSYSYFQFMKQLLSLNYNYIRMHMEQPSMRVELERLGMLCVQMATKFLFHCGFHTKRSLRGPSLEWFEVLHPYLTYSVEIRRWFVQTVFVQNRHRLSEYLLESPSTEIRAVFSKLIFTLCWLTNNDPPFEIELRTSAGLERTPILFSECVFRWLLELLKKEVPEQSRHLVQYFQVFLSYATKGPRERTQLIRLGVPSYFIAVALDEGPGPPLRSPYTDLTKLYAVVSILVRCCDLRPHQANIMPDNTPIPNPYSDPELCVPLPNEVHHFIFERTSAQFGTTYVKKLIEDNCTMDETVRFFGFCSWENMQFSMVVINELLIEIGAVQAFDMRPYLDLLMHLLLLQDSFQKHRLLNCLRGFPHHSEGLMSILQHGQAHYQKRAYLCIKFLVQLCSRCDLLIHILRDDENFKSIWQTALNWLQTEMDRRPYVSSSYNYTGWSPPVQSNEASNGYFLERSNSARMTIKSARELFPLPEATDDGVEDDHEILPGGDPDAGIPADEARVHGIERGPHISDSRSSEQLYSSPKTDHPPPPPSHDGTNEESTDNDNSGFTRPDSN